MHDIIYKVITHCLQHYQSDIIENLIMMDRTLLNWKDQTTGRSLLQIARENQMLTLFIFLFASGCDLESKDANGRSLIDDLAQEPFSEKVQTLILKYAANNCPSEVVEKLAKLIRKKPAV